jgi:arabinofuranosyltransferase
VPSSEVEVVPDSPIRWWLMRSAPIAAAAGLTFAVLLFAVRHAYAIFDDAYIFFRYVQQIYAGCPLSFNCADGPLEGFTSPLYLLLLTLGGLVLPDLELLSQVLCPILLSAALVVTAWSVRSTRIVGDDRTAGLLLMVGLALLWGLDHHVLLYSVVGVEAGLAVLVVALLFRAALSPDLRGLRTLIVVAILTRPESALFALALPVFPQARKVRYWIPLVVAGVAIAAGRWFIFHDILPNTFWAKSGGTWGHFQLGMEYILAVVVEHPVILASPLALLHRGVRQPVVFALIASFLWFAFFLRSGGDFYMYSRLAMPLIPLLGLLAIVGIWSAVRRFRQAPAPWIAVGLAAVLALVAAVRHDIEPQGTFAKVGRWAQVGAFLKHVHPGAKVAATPVGAISYFSGAHVVDIVGVCNREVAKKGATRPDLQRSNLGHERHHTDYVLEQQPDIIVTFVWSPTPFGRGSEVATPNYGEYMLIQAIQEGRAPYRPYTPQVAPGVHWFMFIRSDESAPVPLSGNRD